MCALLLVIAVVLMVHGQTQVITLELGMFAGSCWDVAADDSYRFIDSAIEKFESLHPGVKIHYYSGIRKKDYALWLSEQIISGTVPDIFFVLQDDFVDFVSSGALQNLDDFLSRDESFRPSDFYPCCLASGRFDNSQYALPVESDFKIMGYNKEMLKQRGVELPSTSWTWADYYEDCRQFFGSQDQSGNPDCFGQVGYDWKDAIYANGIKTFSDDGKKAQISDSRFQESIRFMQRLSALNPTQKLQSQDFDEGKVAFMPVPFSYYRTNTSYPYKTSKDLDFTWEFTTMPSGPDGVNASRVDNLLMGISASSEHKILAYEFLLLCTSDAETQGNIYSYSRGASPLDSAELYEKLAVDLNTGYDLSIIPVILRKSEVQPEFEKYSSLIAYVNNEVISIIDEKANTDIMLKNLQHSVQLELEH